MRAITLVKNGSAQEAFEIRKVPSPVPTDTEVLIKVDHFGLNYADVMARKGLYNDAPPLPSVLGYEVVGTVIQLGNSVTTLSIGDRVVALTRFGGYAEEAVADERAAAKLPDSISSAEGTALATQYITAYYMAILQANIQPEEEVLVHAAAGGVGTALTQLAKWRGCKVWGTAGSEEKLKYAQENGVDYPINYREKNFAEEIQRVKGKDKIDVIFDPVGGKSFKEGRKVLSWGGRMVLFGVSNWSDKKGTILDKLRLVWDFGFVHPLGLLMKSQSVIGVNMLKVGDVRPQTIKTCITEVVKLTESGVLKPHVSKVYSVKEMVEAHEFLGSRKSKGKVAVKWD